MPADQPFTDRLCHDVVFMRDVAGLRLTDVRYRGGVSAPVHVHDRACFSAALRGTFAETYGERSVEWKAGAAGFHPADEAHSNRIGDRGARLFIIEMNDRSWTRDPLDSVSRSIVVGRGALSYLTARMYDEAQQMDAVSPLAIEGIALEMIAEASRLAHEPHADVAPWLRDVRDLLHARFAENLTVAAIAAEVAVHPVHLCRAFRKAYGCTIGEYVRKLRVELACRKLASTEMPLAEVALAAGFCDQSHLTRTFSRLEGMTPARYRALHRSR